MEHPNDRYLFDAIVKDVRPELDTQDTRLDLAARDPRIREYANQAVHGYGFYYSGKDADNIMHDYGLAPWDIDAAILRSLTQLGTADQETLLAIANASHDPYVIRTLQWLVRYGSREMEAADDYREELKGYVADTYELPHTIGGMIIGECEYRIREEGR